MSKLISELTPEEYEIEKERVARILQQKKDEERFGKIAMEDKDYDDKIEIRCTTEEKREWMDYLHRCGKYRDGAGNPTMSLMIRALVNKEARRRF